MARKADPTTRGRLLVAARAEFSVSGLEGAKVSAITKRAGISKGAFYLHFDTKDRAFEEVAHDFLQVLHTMIEECSNIVDSDRDIETLANELITLDVRIMDFLWGERLFARVLFEGAHSSKHFALIEVFATRVQAHLESLLSIDVRRGRLPADTNTALFAAFLAGGWDRYARRLLQASERPNIEADILALYNFIAKGLFLASEARFEARISDADLSNKAAQ